ncbi:MAG TPA: hypothetical protein VI485_17360 [Vicinamibacterales bacterium]|nr:hypothetical protein [Vicinamibacterales bacterium]
MPVGVGADLGSGDQKGVAPALGFQLWKSDHYFIGAFFTVAATDPTVSDAYGGFVLNPPLKGRSFYVSGNYMLNNRKDMTPPVLFGIGGRWGTTSSSFEFTPTGGTAIKQDGFGVVASLTAQVVSKTHYISLGDGDQRSEFQLGVELGPTWRLLGGDLSENDSFRSQLLGTDKSSFAGFEMTFFLRVNAVQPFARFTNFSRPDGVVVPGLTGRQVVWGINVASALFNAKTD